MALCVECRTEGSWSYNMYGSSIWGGLATSCGVEVFLDATSILDNFPIHMNVTHSHVGSSNILSNERKQNAKERIRNRVLTE